MLLIESCISIVAVVAAIAVPRIGSGWFEACERTFARLAQRRALAILVVGLGSLAARAALFPILPIPKPDGFDEFGYLLLADTFAHGRVTNPTHPMWVHFESFHIIWQPTYTAKFYPAQGLIMAVGQLTMGHPFWGVWLSIGIMCAAICWMLQGWLPPGWALLGGFLAAIRLGTFSYWANSYWGGAVAATGGALVLGALPRIKQSQRVRDALLMGLGFAIVANSRPYEGLFFAVPVAGALAVWMFESKRHPCHGAKESDRWWKHVAVPLFVIMVLTGSAMAYYFWRTTGSPWQPPYLVDARTYNPAPYFPWQPLKPIPAYHHQVFRGYYVDGLVARYRQARTVGGVIGEIVNVPMVMAIFYVGPVLALPLLMALATVPYGTSLKDVDWKTGFLLLVCGTVTVGSMLPTVFMPHYVAPIACAVLAVVLQAMRRLRSLSGRHQQPGLFITRAVPLICLVMLALRVCAKPLHLPEPRPWLGGGVPIWCALTPSNPQRAATLARLQELPGRQLAIVHYGPDHEICFHEWVYNEADIDRAKVVWARDMGAAKNAELINYFKDRHVWLLEPDEDPPRLSPYPFEESPPKARSASAETKPVSSRQSGPVSNAPSGKS
ncbi:MAG: hypothetical protein ABSH52_26130 [Terriglobia bacterium]|jgi:hypothetical protein